MLANKSNAPHARPRFPQDAPYIWWMTLTIIGTVCLFTLLGAVLYAHRKGWLLTFVEHGDLSSINGPQAGLPVSLVATVIFWSLAFCYASGLPV